jgi:hypothetical protein
MDLKVSLKGSWKFSQESNVRIGTWIDRTKTENQLTLINSNIETKRENLVQGSIEGTLKDYRGIALALNVMNVKPIVARGIVELEATASANAIYSNVNTDDNLMCLMGDVAVGLKASFHAGLSGKFKLKTRWFKGKSIGSGVSYDKDVESDAFLKLKYDGCKTEALDFTVNQPHDNKITIGEIKLKNANGTLRTVDTNSIVWQIYRKAPYELLKTFTSTDSVNIDDLNHGYYVIILKLKDENGMELIKVQEYNFGASPVITILGDNPATVTKDSIYHDTGATAHDDVDGDVTSAIVKSGTVDTSKSGTYTITYSVKDSTGNEATATRTVKVVDGTSTAPIATITASPTSVIEGESITFDGSSSSDSDGSISR